jgi:hypothetical protein
VVVVVVLSGRRGPHSGLKSKRPQNSPVTKDESMNDVAEITPAQSNSLVDLAARIRNRHEAVAEALKHSVEHAMAAGDLLIEAKAQLKHGQWGEWLQTFCSLSERTAQRYIRLARNREATFASSSRLTAPIFALACFSCGINQRTRMLRTTRPCQLSAALKIPKTPLDNFYPRSSRSSIEIRVSGRSLRALRYFIGFFDRSLRVSTSSGSR